MTVARPMSGDEEEQFRRFLAWQEWERRHGPLQAERPKERTIGEMHAEWLKGLSGIELKNRASQGRHITRPFSCRGEELVLADLTPSQLTPLVITSWLSMLSTTRSRQGRKEPLAPGTVDQIRMGVQSMCKHFVGLGELRENPFRAVPRDPDRDRERQGYYAPAELERQAAALPHPGCWILRHAFATGARKSNIRLLRKHQIDWAAKDLVLVQKGGRPLRVVVPDATLEEMRHLCALSPSEWVYPNPRAPMHPLPEDTLQGWMVRARRITGITLAGEAPTIHHARHGHAVDALDRGADLTEVQAQLGHSSIEQTARYAKMRDRMRDRLRAKLNAKRPP